MDSRDSSADQGCPCSSLGDPNRQMAWHNSCCTKHAMLHADWVHALCGMQRQYSCDWQICSEWIRLALVMS